MRKDHLIEVHRKSKNLKTPEGQFCWTLSHVLSRLTFQAGVHCIPGCTERKKKKLNFFFFAFQSLKGVYIIRHVLMVLTFCTSRFRIGPRYLHVYMYVKLKHVLFTTLGNVMNTWISASRACFTHI